MIRKFFIALLLILLPQFARAQTSATILAASATSSAPGSSPITCLLDTNCQGYWSPGSKDEGIDEGIYIQFENPVSIKSVDLETDQPQLDWRLYVNGKTDGKNGPYTLASSPIGTVPIGEKVKSLFLKLEQQVNVPSTTERIKVKKIKLFGEAPASPLSPVLPHSIAASIMATSILEPVTAYHPANLFDSKYDFAWSTNGKVTDGKGQSVVLTLNTPQTLGGLLVWNGYQRSDSHFKANGRVSELEVKSATGEMQKIALKDQMGMQKVSFAKPVSGAQLTLTISGIYPGQQYKDVLISELRLLDQNGKMLVPDVKAPVAAAPVGFQDLVDRSYASILHPPSTGKSPPAEEGGFQFPKSCDNSRIRLRQNGSFVIYTDFDYGKRGNFRKPTNINANVMEGNWEPKGDKIRIFGRKYMTAIASSDYLGAPQPASAPPRVGIFQSELNAKRYSQLSPQEKTELFAYLWTKKKAPANKNQPTTWPLRILDNSPSYNPIQADNYDEWTKEMDALLTKLNPIYLNSSVLSDLLIPSSETMACFSGG